MAHQQGYPLSLLAEKTGARLVGEPGFRVLGVNTLEEASSEELSFLASSRYREAMKRSRAGAFCVDSSIELTPDRRYLVSDHPSLTFQRVAELFVPPSFSAFQGIHPTAVIHETVRLGPGVSVGPYAVIDRNVSVGARSVIGPLVAIGFEVEIGSDCYLHSSSVVRERCQLKNRVVLQPGAVVGSCGFGYTADEAGALIKLEQIGIVVLEDDVEIGANTTIDRSRFRETRVGQGTKIDNLCQIAHNVHVGPHNAIAAQTGIAGSAKTGHHCMLGGQVGILGHVTLGDEVLLATRSGASKGLKKGKYRGSPALPIEQYHRQEVHTRRLEEYVERLKALEEEVHRLGTVIPPSMEK